MMLANIHRTGWRRQKLDDQAGTEIRRKHRVRPNGAMTLRVRGLALRLTRVARAAIGASAVCTRWGDVSA